jgi:hypothetical protein
MTSLELKLASILELIAQARAARDALVLAALLQRKDAICATLAAPEQSWHEAPAHASNGPLEREVVALVA